VIDENVSINAALSLCVDGVSDRAAASRAMTTTAMPADVRSMSDTGGVSTGADEVGGTGDRRTRLVSVPARISFGTSPPIGRRLVELEVPDEELFAA